MSQTEPPRTLFNDSPIGTATFCSALARRLDYICEPIELHPGSRKHSISCTGSCINLPPWDNFPGMRIAIGAFRRNRKEDLTIELKQHPSRHSAPFVRESDKFASKLVWILNLGNHDKVTGIQLIIIMFVNLCQLSPPAYRKRSTFPEPSTSVSPDCFSRTPLSASYLTVTHA